MTPGYPLRWYSTTPMMWLYFAWKQHADRATDAHFAQAYPCA